MTEETEKAAYKGKPYLAIHALIDRSGSMGGMEGQVIRALNDLVAALQTAFMPPYLAVDMFSTGPNQAIIEGRSVVDVPVLKAGDYYTLGGTATSTALCRAIAALEPVKATKKVVIVLTDGDDAEQGGGQHRKAKQLIAECRAKGWCFIVMATNINPDNFADSFVIPRETAIRFDQNIPAAMRAVAHLCLRAGDGTPAFTAEEREAATPKKKKR